VKREYDFSRAMRGPIVPPQKGKTRITIRLDDDLLDWFRARVHERGGGNCQTLINDALLDHITRQDDFLADTLRRVDSRRSGRVHGTRQAANSRRWQGARGEKRRIVGRYRHKGAIRNKKGPIAKGIGHCTSRTSMEGRTVTIGMSRLRGRRGGTSGASKLASCARRNRGSSRRSAAAAA
jgi:hypothetical protein